jgi:hypothetical protein
VRQEVFYEVSAGTIDYPSDAFLSTGLFPAMKSGGLLQLTGGLSPKLLKATEVIQDIFVTWLPDFRRVTLRASPRQNPGEGQGAKVGAFFSGGLDSFYTLLKHREEISHLIFVWGFDIPIDDPSLHSKVSSAIHQAARELGKPLIEVKTNLRGFSDQYVPWIYFFGAALASVALLLQGEFRKIYIPASETYAHLDPCGSHPLIDPLWSTEELEIVHDGCEAGRGGKAEKIADCDTALKHLRVCWENRGGDYNCGRCEKCLRTMINLHLAGALERCAAFKNQLEPEAVREMEIENDLVYYHIKENLREVLTKEGDGPLSAALRSSLLRYDLKKNSRLWGEGIDDLMHWAWGEGFKKNLFNAFWKRDRKWLAGEVAKAGVRDLGSRIRRARSGASPAAETGPEKRTDRTG